MSSRSERVRCERSNLVASYALALLNRTETQSMGSHLAVCPQCQREYNSVSGLTDALTASRMQELPAPTPLWERLMERIAHIPQKTVAPGLVPPLPLFAAQSWQEPQWKEVAPGITCKLLSTDEEMNRVSMLVRLAPNTAYPPHRHAGTEELYLLEGELWIEERILQPGDYNRADPGTSDRRVWSKTGCMCLLITSPSDELR